MKSLSLAITFFLVGIADGTIRPPAVEHRELQGESESLMFPNPFEHFSTLPWFAKPADQEAGLFSVSDLPSDAPSSMPSDAPSMMPSDAPSMMPSDAPSMVPSMAPSFSADSAGEDVAYSGQGQNSVPSQIQSGVVSTTSSQNSGINAMAIGVGVGAFIVLVAVVILGIAYRRRRRNRADEMRHGLDLNEDNHNNPTAQSDVRPMQSTDAAPPANKKGWSPSNFTV